MSNGNNIHGYTLNVILAAWFFVLAATPAGTVRAELLDPAASTLVNSAEAMDPPEGVVSDRFTRPIITEVYYERSGVKIYDAVEAGQVIAVKGRNFTRASSRPDVRLYRMDVDETFYTDCALEYHNSAGTGIWITFEENWQYLEDTEDPEVGEEDEYFLSVRGENGYLDFFPVQLRPAGMPVISRIYYRGQGGTVEVDDAIRPLTRIYLEGADLDAVETISLVSDGLFGVDEEAFILAEEENGTGMELIFNCVDVSYFISSLRDY